MNCEVKVKMKKYALSLEPGKVARMREEARRAAVREGRDCSWVTLLRRLIDKFLTETGGAGTNNVESGRTGGAQ
jgi:hypothetical protein